MKKRNSKVIVKKKVNIGMLVMGIVAIIVGSYIGNSIYMHREVRFNGELLDAPIVHINYRGKGGNSGDVEIDGKKLHITPSFRICSLNEQKIMLVGRDLQSRPSVLLGFTIR